MKILVGTDDIPVQESPHMKHTFVAIVIMTDEGDFSQKLYVDERAAKAMIVNLQAAVKACAGGLVLPIGMKPN